MILTVSPRQCWGRWLEMVECGGVWIVRGTLSSKPACLSTWRRSMWRPVGTTAPSVTSICHLSSPGNSTSFWITNLPRNSIIRNSDSLKIKYIFHVPSLCFHYEKIVFLKVPSKSANSNVLLYPRGDWGGRRSADGEAARGLALCGVRLGGQEQDEDVRARGGQARGHQRVQLPSVRQVLSVTEVIEKS